MSPTNMYGSWGLVFHPDQAVHRYYDASASLPLATGKPLLPYGNGRSYGDSCLNDGGALIDCRPMSRFLGFDEATGVLRCEAGVLLSEIIELMLPKGWFVPVTPGTKFVTVGGAIANDVHGKNHHRHGTFGRHVPQLELLRSDGTRTSCAPERNAPLFAATVGGLGLTGVITRAELRLKRVAGPAVVQRTYPFADLAEFFALSQTVGRDSEYSVAWLDCVAKGGNAGRGLLFTGDHDADPAPIAGSGKQIGIPFTPPFSLVNGASIRLFNEAYFRRGSARRHAVDRVHTDRFFYPLDRVLNWNRIYGPRGLLQYQCVVPGDDAGKLALSQIVRLIVASGKGSFLAVLKEFGDAPQVGLMSFPMAGYTLALDFPNAGEPLRKLLSTLDGIVAEAGGRVYPAKDARMSSESFRRFFPRWKEFGAYIDPSFSSSFWRRVTQAEPASEASR